MTKAQREKAERELLKKMIKDNPKLKDFLVSATDDKIDHSDLKSLIEPVLADTFEKIRMQGIQIGWYFALAVWETNQGWLRIVPPNLALYGLIELAITPILSVQ